MNPAPAAAAARAPEADPGAEPEEAYAVWACAPAPA